MDSHIKIVKFGHLDTYPDLCHGIFSRLGGYSKKPFNSLNVGMSVGDEKSGVVKNRHIIIETLGGGVPVFINQVHGRKFVVLKKSSGRVKDFNALSKERLPFSCSLSHCPSADGIITDIPGYLLFIQVADCQPVMLYDPVNKVIGNIHSGWKGSLKNIVGKGIDIMRREFHSEPEYILAGIGPSLGPCCGEFINYKTEIPEKFWIYKRGENYFDFWQMTIDQLLEKGVRLENIELSRICTRCSHESFFSYRYEKITGRFACVIGMIGDKNQFCNGKHSLSFI